MAARFPISFSPRLRWPFQLFALGFPLQLDEVAVGVEDPDGLVAPLGSR